MVPRGRRVDSTACGTTAVIRLAIGAILLWIVIAMVGARMIDRET